MRPCGAPPAVPAGLDQEPCTPPSGPPHTVLHICGGSLPNKERKDSVVRLSSCASDRQAFRRGRTSIRQVNGQIKEIKA